MRTTERFYAYLFIQMTTLALLVLYAALTRGAYPANAVCFAGAVLLGIVGYFRPFGEAVFASLLAVCLYGGYTAYAMVSGAAGAAVGWNDVVWLLTFPLFALVGGLREPVSEQALRASHQLAYEKKRMEKDLAAANETMPLDETLGFADRERFAKQLATAAGEVLTSPSAAEHVLLIVETQYYWDYKEQFGFEQTQTLMQTTAELINASIPAPKAKGYLGGGAFAVFFPASDTVTPSYIEVELNVKYNAMTLSRPRREGWSRTRLRYGFALFPSHTTEPVALLSRAKQELERNLRDL